MIEGVFVKQFYNKHPYFCWGAVITHSVIPLILLVSLLWSTEVGSILKDKSYWLVVFLWNVHFLISGKYLSEQFSPKEFVSLGSLGILFWIASMTLAVIMATSSPIYQNSAIYIVAGILTSVVLVVLSIVLINVKIGKKRL
jgi:hypothetical protein